MQFRFEHPQALWLLLALLPLAAVMLAPAFRDPLSFRIRRFVIIQLAFFFAIAGFSRPQIGSHVAESRGMRANLFVAIDISRSMLARDISPSRLNFATTFSTRLLQSLEGVRVAIYPFAANGYLLMPLTSDINSTIDVLSALTPSMTTNQGTNLSLSMENLLQHIFKMESAAKEREESFPPTQVIILSDGEIHEKLNTDVFRRFKQAGIPIYTVGVGTTTGATIPIEGRFGVGNDYLKDSDGRMVTTKLESESLKQIAQITSGEFLNARFDSVTHLIARIQRNTKMGGLSTSFKVERELFPFLFALAVLCFAFEFALGRWQYAIRAVMLPLALLFPLSGVAENEMQTNEDDATRAVRRYNEGLDSVAKNQPDKAVEAFQDAIYLTKDLLLKKKALFNMGNNFLRVQEPGQAIQAYQQAFDLSSKDAEFDREANQKISENIALAAKIEKMMQQQQQPQDNNQEGNSNSDSKNSKSPADPKGPQKNFEAQQFSEEQKKKMFDLLSSDEQQIVQRLHEQRNKKGQEFNSGKTW